MVQVRTAIPETSTDDGLDAIKYTGQPRSKSRAQSSPHNNQSIQKLLLDAAMY